MLLRGNCVCREELAGLLARNKALEAREQLIERASHHIKRSSAYAGILLQALRFAPPPPPPKMLTVIGTQPQF